MSTCEPTDLLAEEMTLEEETHTYRLLRSPETEFQSCTEFVGQFFEPFVGETVAAKLVHTIPRYKDRTIESLLAEWKQAADQGTLVHAQIEEALLSGNAPLDRRALKALAWLEGHLPRNEYEYFVERIVFSESLGIAGTIDLLARHRISGEWTLVDWKTNKRINHTAYNGKCGILGPAKQLEDCHTVKYGLQLTLYRYILETQYSITPRKQMIVHLGYDQKESVPQATARPIPLDYLKPQLLELLRFTSTAP
jgi:ATP-dependent exoDNAse (exonuclease V) beta subunit